MIIIYNDKCNHLLCIIWIIVCSFFSFPHETDTCLSRFSAYLLSLDKKRHVTTTETESSTSCKTEKRLCEFRVSRLIFLTTSKQTPTNYG